MAFGEGSGERPWDNYSAAEQRERVVGAWGLAKAIMEKNKRLLDDGPELASSWW